MRAVVAGSPGGPDVLHPVELPDPEPGTGQVRIVVEVAAITFADTLVRAGSPLVPPARFPVVLGNGVGGTIDRTGDGVGAAWSGRRVVSTTGGTGGYAELAVAELADLHLVPEQLGLATAVALLADGRTALGLLEAADVRDGDTVVVTAAAGGVGGLLVQLARRAGARVVALAGSGDKLDLARDLGADVAVSYRDAGWHSRVRAAAPRGADVVFDGVGPGTAPRLLDLLRTGGRYVQHGAAGGSWTTVDPTATAARAITVIGLASLGDADPFDLVERVLAIAAAGEVRATVGQTYPLADAAAAHALIEGRSAVGKTLLLP